MGRLKAAAAVTAAVVVLGSGSAALLQDDGSKTYRQSGETFGNPLMGYAPCAWLEEVAEDTALVYAEVTWSELEPQNGVYDWNSIEEKNQFVRWRREGKHLILRFVCDVPGEEKHRDIPDWLYEATGADGDWYDMEYGQGYSPDYSNPDLIRYHTRAVERMGERWGGDEFLAYIELGSLGHWGEWHVNYEAGIKRLPEESVRRRYVTPWVDAFPESLLLMRRPFQIAAEYGFGLYNDMMGKKEDTEEWLQWIEAGGEYWQTGEKDGLREMTGFWQQAPSGGELTSSLTMEKMLKDDLADTVQMIRAAHTTFLGPKVADDAYPEGYDTLLHNMGYRLWIRKSRIEEQESGTVLTLTWENSGVAPFYRNWPVYVYVEDQNGTIVEERQIDMNLSEIQPGTRVKTSVELDREAKVFWLQEGRISIGIRNPLTGEDAVRLANEEADSYRMTL